MEVDNSIPTISKIQDFYNIEKVGKEDKEVTLDYIEESDDYPYNIAEICFDDDEENLYLEVEKILISKGWKLNYSVENWAYVELVNFEEYKKFSRAYKAALKKVNQKKSAR